MKYMKTLIAASVIAASFLAGSAFAGREGGVKQTRQAEQARPMDAASITSQTATSKLHFQRKSRGSTYVSKSMGSDCKSMANQWVE